MTGSGVVERYLACLGAQGWDGLAATIADEGLIRDGPFCDVDEGKEPYIAFLRGVFSHLQGYQLQVKRSPDTAYSRLKSLRSDDPPGQGPSHPAACRR
jgi:hypothetical protein